MTLDENIKHAFKLWAKQPRYLQLTAETHAEIKRYTDVKKCMVAFSGGKDSTVLLHLALQVDPDIYVFLWDQGPHIMPREVHAEICQNAKTLGAKNFIVETLPCQADPAIRDSPRLWGLSHRWRYHLYAELRRRYGWRIQFIGLRSEESCSRRRVCSNPRRGEVYPLRDWGWRDIWAYIVSNQLPYPKLYDKYAPLLGWDKARFVSFFHNRFENLGDPYLDGFFYPEYRNIYPQK